VVVLGQVILAGRTGNDWSGATATISDTTVLSGTTDANGNFAIADVPAGTLASISADADGFLPAVCTAPTASAPDTDLLPVTLLSGDVNDDNIIDITDATAVGVSFGETGPGLAADINRDGIVDVFDVILIAVNFGQVGPQAWTCQ
jgi:hypothetical protein